MGKTRYKLIIFDLGNVVIDFDHWIATRRLLNFTHADLKEVYNFLFDSGLTQKFEAGKLTGYRFFSLLKRRLNLNISYRDFVPVWNEIFFVSPQNRKVHRFARFLKRNYRIALLSNINRLHFGYIRKKFPQVLKIFSKAILSYKIGFIKPNPLIYKKALKIYKLRPQEVVYIDDRKELTDAAAKLSINSLHFKNAAKLKRDLFSLGIKL
ncbi:MAG: HAD family phosphatase [Candidatus Omnitrophota bacterium]